VERRMVRPVEYLDNLNRMDLVVMRVFGDLQGPVVDLEVFGMMEKAKRLASQLRVMMVLVLEEDTTLAEQEQAAVGIKPSARANSSSPHSAPRNPTACLSNHPPLADSPMLQSYIHHLALHIDLPSTSGHILQSPCSHHYRSRIAVVGWGGRICGWMEGVEV